MVLQSELTVGARLRAIRHVAGHCFPLLVYKGEVITVAAVYPQGDDGKGAFASATRRSSDILVPFSLLDRFTLEVS